MSYCKSKVLTAAAVFGVASIGGWIAGLAADHTAWSLGYVLPGVGFLASVICGTTALYLIARQHQLARRYFDVLGRIDGRRLARDNSDADLPALPPWNAWHDDAMRFKERIKAHVKRLEEAEHARTALEVRVRRNADDCRTMSSVLSGLGEPVVVVDQLGDLAMVNDAARRLLHLESEEEIGRPLDEALAIRPLVQLLEETRRHRCRGSRTAEIELIDEAGLSHWYNATARPVRCGDGDADDDTNNDGAPHGAVAILRDVSDQKAIQKRHAEFVSAASHEMKTPLAGIKAYVELLADGDAEDEATREEFLGVINGQADRLQRLIDNLLNLARIEAGVVSVSKEDRSLNELLDEALGVVQPSAEAKRITLTAELSPMYLGVHVDHDMFLQSVINLLSNAIKYTVEGGRVTLRSRLKDSEVEVEVEDTGVGLSEEDCHHVFEKFYRVKKDRSMAAGTGLGLPLAKHIVEDVHGGSLRVTSTLGEGSTFAITIPGAGQMKARAAAVTS